MKKLFAWTMIATMVMSLRLPYSSTANPDRPLWMRYPVISPDGQTIVFSYKGDLYKVDTKGGVAIPITLSEGYDFMPVFSPDGKTLVFASDRHGNYDLFSVPLAGGTSKRLTFHSAADYPYCFSPDGKTVIFGSSRGDNATMTQFPYSLLGETYSVSVDGGREKQELSICAEDIKWNKKGTKMLFHDRKGYEDAWRKHHTSSVTRDLWMYNKTDDSFRKLTDFEGEDRNPVWNNDESEVYYLSEKSGSFNVWKFNENNPSNPVQVTKFDKNPVRFLSMASNNALCFGYDGEIYTQNPGEEPKRVEIRILTDERYADEKTEVFTNGATEMYVSPNGKEIAFIVRGEVFVTSMEGGVTKRITNTPEQERNVSFSPDGKAVLYASERNNSWGIYQTKITRKEETYFFNSTLLTEEALVVNANESFQPTYSPDGKEIAYLENRTAVNIYNIDSKKTRNVLPANKNYSYSDGDQSFDWSPDSKYLLVNFLQDGSWHEQIGLIDVTGKKPMLDLTRGGFSNGGASFQMNGKMMLWYSNRNGMKNVASHGSQQDAYGLFFNKEAYDQFKMKQPEYGIWKDLQEKNKPKSDTVKKIVPLKIDEQGLHDRKVRLTMNSSHLSDVLMSPDGEKLYYFTSFDDGTNLWVRDFKKEETKILSKLNAGGVGNADFDADAKHIFCMVDGQITKIDVSNGERKTIPFSAEMTLKGQEERAYLFEHMWRQAKTKFYVTNLQDVDWDYYKGVYAKYLPYINNNNDFAEMCSEMLGELNASHTGCRYRPNAKNADQTAELGAFFDPAFTAKGLKIQEVLEKGPLMVNESKIQAGCIIEKIDGNEILPATNYYPFLNRKAGVNTLLSVYDPATGKRWEETVKPIGRGEAFELYYERWVKRMQAMTDKLSGGQLGYMHVEGMNDEAYREFYDQVMGKYYTKKALIVDTRFNGGGWLHDDLATFLSGKKYIEFMPREQKIGIEPASKWTKASVVLMGEGNYSDAHMFPVVYKTLGIGKLVGMPVPGTGTAVWWETLQDRGLVFGIPQVGVMTMDGKYYENNQCEPDIRIENDYKSMLKGEDAQLKKAVESLMGM